jgi:hypothetical protein
MSARMKLCNREPKEVAAVHISGGGAVVSQLPELSLLSLVSQGVAAVFPSRDQQARLLALSDWRTPPSVPSRAFKFPGPRLMSCVVIGTDLSVCWPPHCHFSLSLGTCGPVHTRDDFMPVLAISLWVGPRAELLGGGEKCMMSKNPENMALCTMPGCYVLGCYRFSVIAFLLCRDLGTIWLCYFLT